MNNRSMEDWIQGASHQLKTNPNTVKAAINNGDIRQLTANMSQADQAKVQSVLNDPEKMKELLQSPAGKALLKLFGKKLD
ncbi:MAG: hypothetical protein IKT68_02755 [Clostridia bacterium]|nr:hypothetical protein [Clostridia bacterium]